MRNRHTPSTLKGLLAAALVAGAAASAFAQSASSTYHGAQRDPFTKYKPALKKKVEKKVAAPVGVPPIQQRIEKYKAQKLAAMNLRQAAPKPTTALTLAEVQVIGIFRTPRGYAAMVEATPIKLSYVVYPGEQFFDGMLVAIEETRLVFRKQTRWTDGRNDVAVESKALRHPSAADALTAQRAEQPAPAAAEEKKSELSLLVDALKALAGSGAQQQQQQQQPAQPGGAEAQAAGQQSKP